MDFAFPVESPPLQTWSLELLDLKGYLDLSWALGFSLDGVGGGISIPLFSLLNSIFFVSFLGSNFLLNFSKSGMWHNTLFQGSLHFFPIGEAMLLIHRFN